MDWTRVMTSVSSEILHPSCQIRPVLWFIRGHIKMFGHHWVGLRKFRKSNCGNIYYYQRVAVKHTVSAEREQATLHT